MGELKTTHLLLSVSTVVLATDLDDFPLLLSWLSDFTCLMMFMVPMGAPPSVYFTTPLFVWISWVFVDLWSICPFCCSGCVILPLFLTELIEDSSFLLVGSTANGFDELNSTFDLSGWKCHQLTLRALGFSMSKNYHHWLVFQFYEHLKYQKREWSIKISMN